MQNNKLVHFKLLTKVGKHIMERYFFEAMASPHPDGEGTLCVIKFKEDITIVEGDQLIAEIKDWDGK